jgi:hypothetical protein
LWAHRSSCVRKTPIHRPFSALFQNATVCERGSFKFLWSMINQHCIRWWEWLTCTSCTTERCSWVLGHIKMRETDDSIAT